MLGHRLSDRATHLNVLSYGPPGTGKTTAALSLANLGSGRVMLIDAEAGAKSVALRRMGIDVDRVDLWPDSPADLTYAGIEDLYMDLRSSDEYAGVVVDSMTELNRRLLEGIVGAAVAKAERLGKPARDPFQVNLEDYGMVSGQMRTLLRRFRDLPVHLVLTALERRDVDDDGAVTYGPALGPAVANDTMGLVDVVCYHSVVDIGDERFYLGATAPSGRRRAKDRFGLLPASMVDPTAERMVGYIEGALDRETDPLQDRARKAVARASGGSPTNTSTSAE